MSSRKPKSALDRERYTAELSTGQLVIGVCILLMFGLGCFLLGVLIGKFDPTLREQVAGMTPEVSDPPQTDTRTPQEEAPADPVRPTNSALPPEIRPPRTLDQPSTDAEPISTTPSGTSGTATGTPAETPSETPAQGESTVTTAQSGTPPEPTAAAPGPTETPADSSSTQPVPDRGTEAPPAPLPSPRTAEPPPVTARPAAQPSRALYGVQIIAVARPRAENVKRDIEARSTYEAQIIPIDGDRLCKVVVGGFSDERSALQARDEMRTRYLFRDAFVVTLR